mgnify:CR=1 FL=1
MTGKQLKNSILQWAIQGKLVPQDPNDEPASVLLERIREEKERLIKEKKIKRDKNASIIYRGDDNSHYEKFADGTVKCIDEEIPFELPNGWEWCRLKNIVDIKGGKRLPIGCKLIDEKTSHIYIRVSDMQNGTIVDSDLKYITEDVYELIKNYTISKNDLYLTIVGSTIGKAGYVPRMFDNMNLTENAVKFTNIPINKDFLLFYIQSEYAQLQFRDKTKQVGQPKLAIFRIENTLIPIPPILEQGKIVEQIRNVLLLVDNYSKYQDELNSLNLSINELLKKSILQEAIQGKLVEQCSKDEPASVLLQRIKAEKERLIKEKKIKRDKQESIIYKGDDNSYYEQIGSEVRCIDDELSFELPTNWQWARHNDLFEISGGSQPPKSKFSDTPKEGYIRLYQIRDYGTSPQPVYIPIELASKISKKGDILLARYGASLGKVFEAENGAYNVAMAKVIPLFDGDMIYKPFLMLYYKSYIYQGFVTSANRSAQAGFNKEDLANLLFPLPPIQEQQRITNKIEQLFQLLK